MKILATAFFCAIALIPQTSKGDETSKDATFLDDGFGGDIVVERSSSENNKTISYSVKIFDTNENQFGLDGDVGAVILYVCSSDGQPIVVAPLAFQPQATSKDYDRQYLSFEFSVQREYEKNRLSRSVLHLLCGSTFLAMNWLPTK